MKYFKRAFFAGLGLVAALFVSGLVMGFISGIIKGFTGG